MHVYKSSRVLILVLSLLPLAGCGFRNHPVQVRTSTAQLRDASLDQLVENINATAGRLKSLKATVDIDSSVLEKTKNNVKDYPQIGGYVLVRKPEMLRMIGLYPVVRNRAFDMVSNGKTFELSIPQQNKFIVGSSKQEGRPSEKPLENIRPQHIFDALLLKPIDGQNEIAVLENGRETVKDVKTKKDVDQADYIVLVIRHDDAGYYLSRKIVFSRTDLQSHEQMVYDRVGRMVTYARYENFADHSGIMFPSVVSIQRPIEGYSITLSIVKLDINQPLTDDQFVLNQPPGSQLVNIDNKSAAALAPNPEKKAQ